MNMEELTNQPTEKQDILKLTIAFILLQNTNRALHGAKLQNAI